MPDTIPIDIARVFHGSRMRYRIGDHEVSADAVWQVWYKTRPCISWWNVVRDLLEKER